MSINGKEREFSMEDIINITGYSKKVVRSLIVSGVLRSTRPRWAWKPAWTIKESDFCTFIERTGVRFSGCEQYVTFEKTPDSTPVIDW